MATVGLRFNANPAHVRTARLVAAAVARQAGVGESVLDEVRLAVGEEVFLWLRRGQIRRPPAVCGRRNGSIPSAAAIC